MKKCPNCQTTFDDNMRFCQTDGTPLVDDVPAVEAEPAFDPYATIVGTKANVIEIAPEEPTPPSEPSPAADAAETDEPMIHQTIGSMPIGAPEDVLDLPSSDPLKTMYVSETEMQAALNPSEPEVDIVELPPIEETPAPEPPSFLSPDAPPSGFDAPPPSPFAAPSEPMVHEPTPMDEAATMIQPTFEPPAYEATPSPFDAPTPAFDAAPSPFDTPSAAPVAEWTPPPDAGWQNQEIGSNTPFQPPPAGVAAGENKTLAIISLVLGILSCLCCFSVITGPAGIITGFMAKKKADEDPTQYGGRSLALGGMVTGAIGFVIGVAVIIMQIFFGVLNNLG